MMQLALSATRADNAEVKASQLEQEKSLAENENLVLKSSLFTWQQKVFSAFFSSYFLMN